MKTFHGIILAGIVCVMLMAAGCTNSSPSTTTTPAATTAAPAPSLLTGTTPVTPAAEAPSWSGTWNSTWLEVNGNQTISVLSLDQTGSEVSGTYRYSYPGANYTGTLNATVRGDTLAGTYSESDNDVGLFTFKQSEDQNTFTGRWVHAKENQSALANSTLFWNGVRQ